MIDLVLTKYYHLFPIAYLSIRHTATFTEVHVALRFHINRCTDTDTHAHTKISSAHTGTTQTSNKPAYTLSNLLFLFSSGVKFTTSLLDDVMT